MRKIQLDDAILAIVLGTPGPRGLRGIPTVLWGAPGAAKTMRIEQAAEVLGEPNITLTPQHDETTYGIVPFVDGEHVRTPSHEWTERFRERGIIILDDLTSHGGPVHAAQLRLLTHRETGSAKLGQDVAVIGLANLCADAANGRPLAPAMANRFLHLVLELPWPEVAQYLLDMEAPVFPRLRAHIDAIRFSWDHAFAIERRRMAGFVTARGPAMDAEDHRDDIDATVRASARSVELCVRAVTAARIIQADHLIPSIVAGTMGRGHEHAYVEYTSHQTLPSDEEVLTTWFPKYGQTDITFLVLGRLVGIVRTASGDVSTRTRALARYWQIVAHATRPSSEDGAQLPADIVVPSAKALAKLGHYPPHGVPHKILEGVML